MGSQERAQRRPDMSQPGLEGRVELQPFSNRSFVIIGGSSGLGLTFGIEAKRLGARHVLLGSSDLTGKNTDNAIARFNRLLKGDMQGVGPFLADITKPEQIEKAIAEVQREGIPVTDVFISAAGGMKEFGGEFQSEVREINAIKNSDATNAQAQVEDRIRELNGKLDLWLPQYRDSAIAINFDGPKNIVEAFRNSFENFSLGYVNSPFGKTGVGPHHYENVALKVLFSRWLGENAQALADERGIDTYEITAAVIEDTDVGRLIMSGIVPLSPEDLANTIVNTAVQKADVVAAMNEFLRIPKEERAQYGRPYHRYVFGDGGEAHTYEELPPQLVIDVAKYPF